MGQLRPVRSEERTATVLSMPDEESLPVLDEAGVRDQLLAFARDLNRIYHKERARAEELEHTLHELEESYFATVKTLAFVVEARDAHTRSHLSRAHDYAVALAQRVKPELADDRVFRYGFLLHDIGKVGIPDHILRKPSPLTREEWEVMQTHPILGGQMLGPIRFLQRAIPIVECHHERWDGKGYPRGLKGEEIPLAARIFSVVDRTRDDRRRLSRAASIAACASPLSPTSIRTSKRWTGCSRAQPKPASARRTCWATSSATARIRTQSLLV